MGHRPVGPAEIAKAGLYRAGGQSILLGRHRGKLLAFNGDLHPFLAAATGTGKGVGFVVPNLLHWQGSAIVLDIKGENYSLTSGYRGRVLGQKVFRFDPLQEAGRTHAFNVLDYVRAGDLRVTDVQSVAAILAPGADGEQGTPMDAQKVSAALRELAAEYAGTPRSETARLREVLDDVEAALTAGARHAAVLETLHAQGFTLTASSFESTLAQLRKERKAGQGDVQPRNDAGRHA